VPVAPDRNGQGRPLGCVRDDVAEQCVQGRLEVLGSSADRARVLGQVQGDRTSLVLGQRLPERDPLRDHRPSVAARLHAFTHRAPGLPDEPVDLPGELVHRGALVAMGYWNDAEKTAERYKPLPGRETGLVLPEFAVFSGDTVRKDDEGFLYFIGRRDEMIKTSGYRVSPTEIEEVFYTNRSVNECAAFGVPHPTLGQAIVVIVTARAGEALDTADLLAECRDRLPIFMLPAKVDVLPGPLPRNPNGKIDRKSIAGEYLELFL